MKTKKNSFAHICAYLSLAISITMLVLWCCNVGGFTVVNLDSFVGVIVALLAIVVTLAIGWQIFNSIEIRNKIESLLEPPQKFVPKYTESDVKALGKLLVDCLKEHNCPCEIKSGRCGRVSTIFEIVPQSGVKVKQIEDREEDIALRLGVSSAACRSENGLLLVEIPNGDVKAVKIGELLLGGEYPLKNNGLLVVIGRLVTGEAVFLDIAATPHTLIAGSTGSGKSVCVHAIISNLLLTKSPRELRLILIDPKRTELKRYNSVPHLLQQMRNRVIAL